MPSREITVLIPHYNRPDMLKEALLSIRAQTVQPAEVLVVDDCSRPENQEKLRALRHLATIHENERNMGLRANLNHGATLAKTEWLAFLADDDLFLPRKLELQNAYLDEHPECDILVGPVIMEDDKGKREEWGFQEPRQLTLKDALVNTAILFQSAVMRRETYLSLGGICQPPMEDKDFGIRALEAGYRMQVLPEPLVIYRRGGREQLSLEWAKMFRAEVDIVRRFAHLYRREFGTFGPVKMYARQFKRYGLRRGRYVGRALWAAGCGVHAILGDPYRAWD